jgi:hypothetical protein
MPLEGVNSSELAKVSELLLVFGLEEMLVLRA